MIKLCNYFNNTNYNNYSYLKLQLIAAGILDKTNEDLYKMAPEAVDPAILSRGSLSIRRYTRSALLLLRDEKLSKCPPNCVNDMKIITLDIWKFDQSNYLSSNNSNSNIYWNSNKNYMTSYQPNSNIPMENTFDSMLPGNQDNRVGGHEGNHFKKFKKNTNIQKNFNNPRNPSFSSHLRAPFIKHRLAESNDTIDRNIGATTLDSLTEEPDSTTVLLASQSMMPNNELKNDDSIITTDIGRLLSNHIIWDSNDKSITPSNSSSSILNEYNGRASVHNRDMNYVKRFITDLSNNSLQNLFNIDNKKKGKYLESQSNEPEWFSFGPTSPNDTIELNGIIDETSSHNSSGKSTSMKKIEPIEPNENIGKKTPPPPARSTPTKLQKINEYNILNDDDLKKKIVGHKNPININANHIDDNHQQKKNMEFNFEEFLQLNDILVGDPNTSEVGNSRFSQWFKKTSPNSHNSTKSSIDTSQQQLLHDELNNMLNESNSTIFTNENDDQTKYFTPISPASITNQQQQPSSTLLDFFKKLKYCTALTESHGASNNSNTGSNINGGNGVIDTGRNSLDLHSFHKENTGIIPNVEELEARMRKKQVQLELKATKIAGVHSGINPIAKSNNTFEEFLTQTIKHNQLQPNYPINRLSGLNKKIPGNQRLKSQEEIQAFKNLLGKLMPSNGQHQQQTRPPNSSEPTTFRYNGHAINHTDEQHNYNIKRPETKSLRQGLPQRIPSALELKYHTQSIMQSAVLKKKLEMQQANHVRRAQQQQQQQHHHHQHQKQQQQQQQQPQRQQQQQQQQLQFGNGQNAIAQTGNPRPFCGTLHDIQKYLNTASRNDNILGIPTAQNLTSVISGTSSNLNRGNIQKTWKTMNSLPLSKAVCRPILVGDTSITSTSSASSSSSLFTRISEYQQQRNMDESKERNMLLLRTQKQEREHFKSLFYQQSQQILRPPPKIGGNQNDLFSIGNSQTVQLGNTTNRRMALTSNQLARWFSLDLLAQASAGKLPLLNRSEALSLEEFERHMKYSSSAKFQ